MFIRELLALYVYNYFEMINPTCSFSLPLSFGTLKYGWCSVMGYNSHINMQSNPSDETKYSMYCMDVRSSAYTIEFREDNILQNVKENVFIATIY